MNKQEMTAKQDYNWRTIIWHWIKLQTEIQGTASSSWSFSGKATTDQCALPKEKPVIQCAYSIIGIFSTLNK